MSVKEYGWSSEDGAVLGDHSRKKHQILERYFEKYLETRCANPMQSRFRIAIVDGFSGAGFYACGSPGSPIIFIRTLIRAVNNINLKRRLEGVKTSLEVDCFLVMNDTNQFAIKQLRVSVNIELERLKESCSFLKIIPHYINNKFEKCYSDIKELVVKGKYSNVFFNLDQCGYSHVSKFIVRDIMNSWRSPEVLLTFMFSSMLAFLSEKTIDNSSLDDCLIRKIKEVDRLSSKVERLAITEQVIFGYLKDAAPFSSPFAINNPEGWKYWLIHFARSFRARQVYNDVLHELEHVQIHAGRSGLEMLSYDPRDECQIYLFDQDSREQAKLYLYDDIPRFMTDYNNRLPISMESFYMSTYNETPAHSDDIHDAVLSNPELEVLTDKNKPRRKATAIRSSDTLRLKNQRTFFSMFRSDFIK